MSAVYRTNFSGLRKAQLPPRYYDGDADPYVFQTWEAWCGTMCFEGVIRVLNMLNKHFNNQAAERHKNMEFLLITVLGEGGLGEGEGCTKRTGLFGCRYERLSYYIPECPPPKVVTFPWEERKKCSSAAHDRLFQGIQRTACP